MNLYDCWQFASVLSCATLVSRWQCYEVAVTITHYHKLHFRLDWLKSKRGIIFNHSIEIKLFGAFKWLAIPHAVTQGSFYSKGQKHHFLVLRIHEKTPIDTVVCV